MTDTITVENAIGSVWYDRNSARKGRLRQIVIKKYHIVANNFAHVMYVDTYNGLWNEYDLVPKAVAKQLAINFYERQLI